LLKEASEVFQRHIALELELEPVVQAFTQHKYDRGIIEVCLARANSRDPGQKALHWYRGGRAEDDKASCEKFDERYRCYQLCFDRLSDPNAFDMMLAENDELFHVCLYHHILSMPELTEHLLKSKTPYLLAYLKSENPRMLFKYHTYHKEYEKAAKELIKLVDEDPGATLPERIEWLTRAKALAQAARAGEEVIDASGKLECALVQKALCIHRGSAINEVLPEQDLFDLCASSGEWALVLRLLSFSPVAGDRRKIVEKAWGNFMEEQLGNENLAVAQQKVIEALEGIDPKNGIVAPVIVMPVLENYRLKRNGNVLWAVETLMRAGIAPGAIFDAYAASIAQPDVDDGIKCDFIYAAMLVVRNSEIVRSQQKIKEFGEWFSGHARTRVYYDAGFKVVSEAMRNHKARH
jgi:hypothetical protein